MSTEKHIDSHAEILETIRYGDYVLMTARSPVIASVSRPGQFVMIRITSHPFPLLRRPLGIHDIGKDTVSVFFQEVGQGTRLLGLKHPGDRLDIIGPLGKGFTLLPDLKGRRVVLVGGGRGIAPLYYLLKELLAGHAEVHIFYGGKSQRDLPLLERLSGHEADIHWSTDDGSSGWKGFISDLFAENLDRIRPDFVFTCGPDEMMRKVALASEERRIRCECSLESIMACGFGACWGCVKRIRRKNEENWIKICEEGPVFSSEEIVWNG